MDHYINNKAREQYFASAEIVCSVVKNNAKRQNIIFKCIELEVCFIGQRNTYFRSSFAHAFAVISQSKAVKIILNGKPDRLQFKDIFVRNLYNYVFRIKIGLSERNNRSIHAALRNYVDKSKNKQGNN